MKRLEGKIALVTGAARGVGRGVALCLAEEGADIVVNDVAHDDELDEVVNTIKKMGREALAWKADVADRAQVEATVQATVRRFGRLDIAVANPAYSVRQPTIGARWEDVQRVIAVTQFGVLHTCRLAARQMVAQGNGGKIIIIGSIQAEMPVARSAAYNMAKAAINHPSCRASGR